MHPNACAHAQASISKTFSGIELFACTISFLHWSNNVPLWMEWTRKHQNLTNASDNAVFEAAWTKTNKTCLWEKRATHAKAQVKRRTFHELNLIQRIKFMRSSTFDSIKFDWLYLERLSRSSRLEQSGITTVDRLWVKRRSFHEPN